MRLGLTGLILVFALAPAASGQETSAPKLEVIVSASGATAVPWVTRALCQKSKGRCAMAVMNPETGEVARMGDAVGTDFELTGNGQELRRVETAMDKAIRLKSGR
ncbi:MAG: hypothetical protein RIR33_3615 [Pseudomonadota bacterium]|jgi:predicted transglutaminase-like cysteine proteinase